MFYLTTHLTHFIYGYMEGRKEMFYLTTHSTHFIYGYMASDIWLRTILIVRKETRCRHIGYSYRLTARVLLYAPSHRQDNTYHGLCYTSLGALAGTRNSSMGPPHERSIRRPIAPWANALPLSYVPLPRLYGVRHMVKDNSDSERGNPLPPHGLLFPSISKGSFICERYYHGATSRSSRWNIRHLIGIFHLPTKTSFHCQKAIFRMIDPETVLEIIHLYLWHWQLIYKCRIRVVCCNRNNIRCRKNVTPFNY